LYEKWLRSAPVATHMYCFFPLQRTGIIASYSKVKHITGILAYGMGMQWHTSLPCCHLTEQNWIVCVLYMHLYPVNCCMHTWSIIFTCTLHMKHLLREKINIWKIAQIAVLAIILVGVLYGFFIAIICGQRITERHYHVLAKQELTKVRERKRKLQQVGSIYLSPYGLLSSHIPRKTSI
jgi:hypothetical protein